MVNMTLENLEGCFLSAKKRSCMYVGVKIEMKGFAEPEIIINQVGNFDTKLEYYKKAYNDDLTLKTFNGIKIIGFTYANNFEGIENDLVWNLDK
jgi:hypothetical protein